MTQQLKMRKRLFWESKSALECEAMLREYTAHIQASPNAGALLICVVGAKLSEGINFGDGLGRCVVVFGLPYPDLRNPELHERLLFIERLQSSALPSGETHSAALQSTALALGGAACAPGGAGMAPNGTQIGVPRSAAAGFAGASTAVPGLRLSPVLPHGPVGAGTQLGPVARDMYTNMCMQAVNQCIGRAIRHRGDYAAIVLADVRYAADVGSSAVMQKLPGWIMQNHLNCPASFGPAVQGLAKFFSDRRLAQEGGSKGVS